MQLMLVTFYTETVVSDLDATRWGGDADRLGLCRQESLHLSQKVCSLPLYIHRASFPPFGAFPFWAYWQHLGTAVTAHLALCHCA